MTYICPEGHPCEDRRADAVNPGIYCRECGDWRTCSVCEWVGTRQDVKRYLSNAQAATMGIRKNWRDGGAYGLCPSCENGLVHGKGGWWSSAASLFQAGGRRTLDEIHGDIYTVYDVLEAGYNLEPLICLNCGSDEVTYADIVSDAHCAHCGAWQTELRSTEAHLEIGLFAGRHKFDFTTRQSRDELSGAAFALLSHYVEIALKQAAKPEDVTTVLQRVMGCEEWLYNRYERTPWRNESGVKMYIGHFIQFYGDCSWTECQVTFHARRPVVAMRTMARSGCNPADFAGMVIN